RASRDRRAGAGRYPRQAARGPRREVSVRAQRQSTGLNLQARFPPMSNIPNNLKYLDSHEWARVESDGTVTVGISDHAQGALGDLVLVEVLYVGKALSKGGAAAVVESVKAASDVYSPVSGEVIANNSDALSATPEL